MGFVDSEKIENIAGLILSNLFYLNLFVLEKNKISSERLGCRGMKMGMGVIIIQTLISIFTFMLSAIKRRYAIFCIYEEG